MNFEENNEDDQSMFFLNIADLMTGLMLFFMLIGVYFFIKWQSDVKKYNDTKENIVTDLKSVLGDSLKNNWNGTIDSKGTISFKEAILFDQGKAILKPQFKCVLNHFFPMYINILWKYHSKLEEIRIEGHTSSEWFKKTLADSAYIYNMELSQKRARVVLQYCLSLPINENKDSVRNKLTANGLSSSRLILNKDYSENKGKSRRVEFRFKADAEAVINKSKAN